MDFEITIPGFRIAGKAWGDKKLPPLLALHGWLDNANSFNLLAPYLLDNFYLIAIDLPGHGLSSHLSAGNHYHFGDGVFTLYQIIHALGYEKVHLLGHSMGACLASLAAGVFAEKILSVILIEAIGPFSAPEDQCRIQLANYIQRGLNVETKEARAYASLESAAQARAKRGYISLEHAQILCERGVINKQGKFYWLHDRRLIHPTPMRMTENQILSCLEGITAPSCLIWADGGFGFSREEIKRRMNAVNNLKVYYLAGGHHIHMEHPEAVHKCLDEFYSF